MSDDLIGPGARIDEPAPPTFAVKGSFRFGWVAEWKLQQWLKGARRNSDDCECGHAIGRHSEGRHGEDAGVCMVLGCSCDCWTRATEASR